MKCLAKILIALICLLAATGAFAQQISQADLMNHMYNWTSFRCDSIATASAEVDTLIFPSGRIANLTVYAFAAEAKIKFTKGISGIEWARIAAADKIEIPGLVKPDSLFILGTGTGSVRVTYTVR